VHVTVLLLVFGAAILLTLMVVHSYSREGAHTVRTGTQARRAYANDAVWMFSGDGGAGDGGADGCGAGDGGGGCGDGGGGGD
jgi:hypothetical protein